MNLSESWRFALRGVSANKTRSALTTLGIIIGVASVIILVAVGTGSAKAVEDSISSLGSNTMTVTPTGTQGGGIAGGGGLAGIASLFGGGGAAKTDTGTKTRNPTLTMEDARALTDTTAAPDVIGVAPVVSGQNIVATYEGASHSVPTFSGSTPAYLGINNDTISAGTAFTDADYESHRRVVLLGSTVAEQLVGQDTTALVGQSVSFNGKAFTVVGILGEKGSTGPLDNDDRVIAPATAVQDTLTGYEDLSSISVKASSSDTTASAQDQVTAILDGRHNTTAATRDFSVFNSATILSAATSSNDTFTVLLGAVAAISLLVGGIGVMNIMLVTVTERTREIGIRKAIGAGKGDIVTQFLLEAVILSLLGGVVGVVLGLIGSQFTIVGVVPIVAPYSVVLAFAVALATGLFFGLYPASRAASLRPIDALRYE